MFRVVPEGELPHFVSDLCALEDWNHTSFHFLGHRDSQSDGQNRKKKGDLEYTADIVNSKLAKMADVSVTLFLLGFILRTVVTQGPCRGLPPYCREEECAPH
jgi:hypothetical protein